jgi:hypothetical protein
MIILNSLSTFSSAQIVEDDKQLNERLHHYMLLNKELRFEELMDYVYPKIFIIAPKEEIVKVFRLTFDNELMRAAIDSTSILQISPAYIHQVSQFKKVDYYMEFSFFFKDTVKSNEGHFVESMTSAFKKAFPSGQLEYNPVQRTFLIKANNIMFAVKEGNSEWMFIGYDKSPMLSKLLPKEVLDHFKLLSD